MADQLGITMVSGVPKLGCCAACSNYDCLLCGPCCFSTKATVRFRLVGTSTGTYFDTNYGLGSSMDITLGNGVGTFGAVTGGVLWTGPTITIGLHKYFMTVTRSCSDSSFYVEWRWFLVADDSFLARWRYFGAIADASTITRTCCGSTIETLPANDSQYNNAISTTLLVGYIPPPSILPETPHHDAAGSVTVQIDVANNVCCKNGSGVCQKVNASSCAGACP